MTPTILLVHGFWEGPDVYAEITSQLAQQDLRTHAVTLPSLGKESPGNPGMKDDIAHIRKEVTILADEGKEIVMVLDSGAGFLGSNAVEGLSLASREANNQSGGVSKIVFISAAVFPEGFTHGPLPFSVFEVSLPARNSHRY